ncbi:MAG: hypothetical protein GY855_15055, partial [candidate division Zixibacteria bacterium]|nr:hypothetical protein [candidate division Zixibacteria bacterium]
MKYTQKDLQDLSKIFAPYSQGFTFPATSKNRAAFGFFGDTDAIKINTESKFPAKTLIDGVLDNAGFIKLSSLSYKNNKPEDFTGSFTTSMTNLKDRIGEDLISELSEEPALVPWSIEGVQNMVRSEQTMIVDGAIVKYFAPLISINRVWGYDKTGNNQVLDNIAYNSAVDLKGNNLIRPEDLRPAISYSSIMELIKTKYGLTVISPTESREEYQDLRVWCNSEGDSGQGFAILPINNQFGDLKISDRANETKIPDPKKYTITANLIDNSFLAYKDPVQALNTNYEGGGFTFTVALRGVVISGGTNTPAVDVQYVRKSDDVILKTDSFEIDSEGTSFVCQSLIEDTLFGGTDNLEFYIKVRFKQPTSWNNCTYRMLFRYYHKFDWASKTRHANYYYDSLGNDNSSQV